MAFVPYPVPEIGMNRPQIFLATQRIRCVSSALSVLGISIALLMNNPLEVEVKEMMYPEEEAPMRKDDCCR